MPKAKPSGQGSSALLAVFGSAGFTIVTATFAGFAAGFWIDRRMGTSPWFMVLFLLAGALAALLNVYFRVRQRTKER